MLKFEDLKLALRFVEHAQGDRDIRDYLNGTRFTFEPGTLKLLSCDGHRLAFIDLVIGGDIPPGQYNVARASLKALLAVKSKSDVTFEFKEKSIYANLTDGTSVPLSLLEARFVDYERAVSSIESIPSCECTVNPGYLAEASKAMRLLGMKTILRTFERGARLDIVNPGQARAAWCAIARNG